MERTTLTRNLRPLEDQGYVVLACGGWHRSRVLTLTASGRKVLMEAQAALGGAAPDEAAPGCCALAPEVQEALADLTEESHRPQA